MAVAFVASGTAGVGTTAPAPTYPAGLAAGDLLVLVVVNKYPTNGPATPSGWTAPANNQGTGGQGSAGADAGNVYLTIFYKVSDGTESGSLVLSIPSANTSAARIHAYRNGTGVWGIVCTHGADNTADTSWSVTGAADPGVAAGDWMICGTGINGANGNPIAGATTLTSTGITYGTAVERQDTGTAGGDNCHLVVTDVPADSGTSSAAPSYSFTAAASGTNWPAGATVFMRIREESAEDNSSSSSSSSSNSSSSSTVASATSSSNSSSSSSSTAASFTSSSASSASSQSSSSSSSSSTVASATSSSASSASSLSSASSQSSQSDESSASSQSSSSSSSTAASLTSSSSSSSSSNSSSSTIASETSSSSSSSNSSSSSSSSSTVASQTSSSSSSTVASQTSSASSQSTSSASSQSSSSSSSSTAESYTSSSSSSSSTGLQNVSSSSSSGDVELPALRFDKSPSGEWGNFSVGREGSNFKIERIL